MTHLKFMDFKHLYSIWYFPLRKKILLFLGVKIVMFELINMLLFFGVLSAFICENLCPI